MKRLLAVAASAAFAVLAAGPASADDYPTKPIRLVVPLAAGGGSDVFARLLSPGLEQELGVPVVIVNAPGAGTAIGSRQVLTAKPDGYTVLLNHVALHSLHALGKTDFNFKDFDVIAGTTAVPNMIVARADVPYDSLDNLFAAAREAPETIKAGVNIGAPNHLSVALAAARGGGAPFRYVQTGGATQTLTALLGKQVDIGILTTGDAASFRDTGELKFLAILDDERSADYPDVPTAAEQDVDVKMVLDYYWYMPKGTPQDRLVRFADALEALMAKPELQTQLKERFIPPTFTRGAEATDALASGLASVEAAAEAAGLRK
ncbi:MAG: tripartite tricarboxylate transporter substrate binding protein [Acuticoccus sp.]